MNFTTLDSVGELDFCGPVGDVGPVGSVGNTGSAGRLNLGSWISKTVGASILAATDGFITATISGTNIGDQGYLTGLTDGNNPPTTIRIYSGFGQGPGATPNSSGLMFPVRSGDFYKVILNTVSGTPIATMQFISAG
jgi:hypothetical protein